MKRRSVQILMVLVLLAGMMLAMVPAAAATTQKSVLYAMNYLSPETTTTTTLNDIKGSGFDTVIIFSVDGTSTGDLTFFGTPIFTNGVYV
ncbi:MAG: hypothetical protein K6T54_08235, partial [Ignavibacterium sp.]|nr:hypothetical protein [Ignavibacterium sp.]